jgi:hypothetical protein
MMQVFDDDPSSADRAIEVARRTLEGEYDLVLACRDLAGLRRRLPDVADEIMNIFVGVASEVDELPIGVERKHWATDALIAKDAEAADYRERVRGTVVEALQELLAALGERRKMN